MKVQICRQCGNRNTVVTRPLSECNYCGSTDLEPVSVVESPGGVATSVADNESNKLAWLVLLSVILIILASVWWVMQPMAEEERAAPVALPSIKLASTETKVATDPLVEIDSIAGQEVASETELAQVPSNEAVLSDSEGAEPEQDSPVENGQKLENDLVITDNAEADSSNSNEINLALVQNTVTDTVDKKHDNNAVSDNKTEKQLSTQLLPEKKVEPALQTTKVDPKPDVMPVKPKPVAVVQQPKPVVKKPIVKKSVVKKPVVKVAKATPRVDSAQQIAAQQALKQEQEKVKRLQAILQKKQAKESRRHLRILDRANGVVTDRKTGLMWSACSIGQEWRGGYCAGDADELLWSEAVNSAKQASYAGHGDWRLPTRNELDSLVECSQDRVPYRMANNRKLAVEAGVLQNGKCLGQFRKPTIDQAIFPNTQSNFYWSYTFDASTNYSAWGVFFSGGHHYNFNTSNVGFARLVRTLN